MDQPWPVTLPTLSRRCASATNRHRRHKKIIEKAFCALFVAKLLDLGWATQLSLGGTCSAPHCPNLNKNSKRFKVELWEASGPSVSISASFSASAASHYFCRRAHGWLTLRYY